MASIPITPATPYPTPPPPLGNPSDSDYKNQTLNWLYNARDEAQAFLASQPGFKDIERAIETIMSNDRTPSGAPVGMRRSGNISRTRTNRVAQIAESKIALLTDTKPFWEYDTANRKFEQHAVINSKLATALYQRRSFDLVLGDCLSYAEVAGTGYLHIFWNEEITDVDFCVEDPRNVLPHNPLDMRSLESCMGVTLRKRVPVAYIRQKYKIRVSPDSDGSVLTWLSSIKESISDTVSPIYKFTSQKQDKPLRIPTVDLYTTWIKDPSLNETDSPIFMGQFNEDGKPSNNWSYIVPPGQPLYPQRRLIIWAGSHILYDGPALFWHGKFPLIKVTTQPYPWTWFGKATTQDVLPLQESLNSLLQVIDDHAAQVAEPGAIMDKNSVSKNQFNSFSTRKAGWRIHQNPLAGKGVQIVNPPPLDPSIWKHIDWVINEMQEISGIKDISQLLTLNQLPANSTIEAILNSLTPSLRRKSRILEAVIREVAMQLAYFFAQFFTLPMRVAILGPGGVTQDDFDFDPGSLIPDYPFDYEWQQDPETGQPVVTPEALLAGPRPRLDRAREFLRRLIFKITPGSLLNSAQMESKLIYLQLFRAGVMDIWTLFDVLGIPNAGPLPDNIRTIPERLAYQAMMGLGPNISPVGRKATGQDTPRIVTKETQ